jgi:hypothetical protein
MITNFYINKDCFIDEDVPGNNYNTTRLKSGVYGGRVRIFFSFPTSGIPQNTIISSAKLYLYCQSNYGSDTYVLERITTSWSETGATWNNQPSVSGTIKTYSNIAVGTWGVITITDAFKNWRNGTWANYGIRGRGSKAYGTQNMQGYHSRETEVPANKPYVKVEWKYYQKQVGASVGNPMIL